MKASVLILLGIAAVSCGRRELKLAPGPFIFSDRIGWMQGPCLAIANANLKPGTPVSVVIAAQPQKIVAARVQEQTTSAATCPALTEERAAGIKAGTVFYALEGGGISRSDMALGIVNAPATPTIVDGQAKVDLDQDGRSEVFTSCASSEGINFAVWSGNPYEGDSRWSEYYYVGYDLVPNCP
jgi:hypothetical protein